MSGQTAPKSVMIASTRSSDVLSRVAYPSSVPYALISLMYTWQTADSRICRPVGARGGARGEVSGRVDARCGGTHCHDGVEVPERGCVEGLHGREDRVRGGDARVAGERLLTCEADVQLDHRDARYGACHEGLAGHARRDSRQQRQAIDEGRDEVVELRELVPEERLVGHI